MDLSKYNISYSDILGLLALIDRMYKELVFCVFFPNIMSNINMISLDTVNKITDILAYSDILVFNRKEGFSYFNLLNQLTNYAASNSKISFKQVQDIFYGIKSKRKPYRRLNKLEKVCFFIEDFYSFSVIEQNKDNINFSFVNDFKMQIIPRINHTNSKLVTEYKKQSFSNQKFLHAILFGGFFCKYLNRCSVYYSFLVGQEITKRCLEIFKLGFDLPSESEFYNIIISKSLLNTQQRYNQKETGFVLDCINLTKSKLNVYNPLNDNNLSSFFSSNIVRKHLNEQGFINTRGFLLLDPERKRLGNYARDKSFEQEIEKEKKIMIAVKESSEKLNEEAVRKILKSKSKMLNDRSIFELEKLAMTMNYSPVKNKQLPSFSESSQFSFRPKNTSKVKLKPIKGANLTYWGKSPRNNMNKGKYILEYWNFYIYFFLIFR